MSTVSPSRPDLVADAREAIVAAASALEAAVGHWQSLPTGEVAASFTEITRLRARAEGAAVALLMEAVSRGVVAESEHRREVEWIRAAADEGTTPMTVAAATALRDAADQASLNEPDMSALRSALTRGDVSVATAARLRRDLALITARVPEPVAGTAVASLVEYAATGASSRTLAATREAIIATYGDEGTFEERQSFAHRHREMTGWVKDGHDRNVCTVAVDNVGRATIDAALNALAAPRPVRDEQGNIVEVDPRTAGQRRADSFVELCRVVAAELTPSGDVAERPGRRPSRPHVTLTMPLSDLRDRLGYALDEQGQPLPPSRMRQLCCDAEVIPAVLGTDGEILDLGRSARTAAPGQRRAITHRDRGCTFPGCGRPPSWCDAHHLVHWIDGGRTDVDNLALLCSFHHTQVHQHGYSGQLGPDGHIHWLRRLDRQADRPPGLMADDAPRRLVVNESPAGPHIDEQRQSQLAKV